MRQKLTAYALSDISPAAKSGVDDVERHRSRCADPAAGGRLRQPRLGYILRRLDGTATVIVGRAYSVAELLCLVGIDRASRPASRYVVGICAVGL